MSTGSAPLPTILPNPYVTPTPTDIDPSATVLETTIVVSQQLVNIGGVDTLAEVYNGMIPGPTLRPNVGDTVIVRLVNDLDYPTGIHWHGIELQNSADGTPVTQDGLGVGPFPLPVPAGTDSPAGGTYLYKFKVTRPGVFWYHPHHHHSTNRVFRGLYGMIIVTDPNETTLVGNTLPDVAETQELVLSDITVCKAPGSNDSATYVDPTTLPAADRAEWLSLTTSQPAPTPQTLCEIPPPATNEALNEDGSAATVAYASGEVPNIQRAVGGRTNEGQTVLTNGVNVGARLGTPDDPKVTLEAGAHDYDVQPGQGLRLQIVNCATTRYFRLRLTEEDGTQVPLVRVGGEGGLLDNAVLEGGTSVGPDSFNFNYESGEILLPPSTRADIVVAIPDTATGVLTLWTRDFSRTGPGFAQLPTVPVMHLNVIGATVSPAYTIVGAVPAGPAGIPPAVAGTPLRSKALFPGPTTETLGPATGALLNPSTFVPAKIGQLVVAVTTPDIQDIQLNAGGGVVRINETAGSFSGFSPYTSAPHILSTRYAEKDEILELAVTNGSGAHHPFHLHGFSFQPISLEPTGSPPTYTWPYMQFVDVTNVPSGHTLRFRVRLDDRELADESTPGGALGRWLFHCHIFFHAHLGMISELVVTNASGNEKPNVDVGGSWAYAATGGIAERFGTFSDPDGDPVALSASMGIVTDDGGGNWSWELDTSIGPTADGIYFVYITATDSPGGLEDQTVFRLQVGGTDEGSDTGDPHIHTVDGKTYHFQAVGEFTTLQDREGMEIQTRQRPVPTANPFNDSYSGLTSSVSVNTAVAARVGSHRISYQPIESEQESRLQFYLDGKPSQLSTEGIDLEDHRVSTFDADGETGLRVDYAHGAVLTVTPRFWNSNKIWYMDVSVSHTQGDEGLMGKILDGSWLPTLRSGATVGPKPKKLHERYVALYQTFADSWRVTDETSMFVYALRNSTATFTDRNWPAEEHPSTLLPRFEIPGLPTPVNIPADEAERICKDVTIGDLFADCVFDVSTTGDASFAKGYLFAQNLKLHGTAVQIIRDKEQAQHGGTLVVTAIVLPLTNGRPTPKGSVTFLVDNVAAGQAVRLDEFGRAQLTLDHLDVGKHKIRAAYSSDDGEDSYHPSSSPNLLHAAEKGAHPRGCSWRIIWIGIILVLIAIAAYWYFL